ncbi:hypothetical protein [Nocardia yamanashiensis]|uniref:hypothetical protein n=1 Tax=Nocardia yamanashiensis TaxID=209247 RepID=UPI0008367F01|nr:hypothetical protein [Nocardia yamanashiensis]
MRQSILAFAAVSAALVAAAPPASAATHDAHAVVQLNGGNAGEASVRSDGTWIWVWSASGYHVTVNVFDRSGKNFGFTAENGGRTETYFYDDADQVALPLEHITLCVTNLSGTMMPRCSSPEYFVH